ncbi:Uncharacterised protein [Halioglobus japonicus]|nr:Uncharacterised protein [Halioglobus japonicus]
MANDLKSENFKSLFFILAASLVASVLLQFDLKNAENFTELAVAGTGGLLLSALLVMVANLIPQSIKHKLVFTRMSHELPACRVDRLSRSEPRIDYDLVRAKWPDVFEEGLDGSVRNSRWYQQIYKPVKNEPSVLQAHRSFLLYRDAFSGLLLILITTSVFALLSEPVFQVKLSPWVPIAQVVLTLIALVAARVAGNRFVLNAVAAAEQDQVQE